MLGQYNVKDYREQELTWYMKVLSLHIPRKVDKAVSIDKVLYPVAKLLDNRAVFGAVVLCSVLAIGYVWS